MCSECITKREQIEPEMMKGGGGSMYQWFWQTPHIFRALDFWYVIWYILLHTNSHWYVVLQFFLIWPHILAKWLGLKFKFILLFCIQKEERTCNQMKLWTLFVFRKIPLFVKQHYYGLSNTQHYPCLDNVWTEASGVIIFQI